MVGGGHRGRVGGGTPDSSKPKNSILNYFSKTPKSTLSSPVASAASIGSDGLEVQVISQTPRTPSASHHQNDSVARTSDGPSLSSSNNNLTPKRMIEHGSSSSAESLSKSKRPKIETPPDLFGSQAVIEGTLVWAKLQGYPFWPAMLRGETKVGDSFFRKVEGLGEFHVQFFDEPPSRAWIRKADIKPYRASSDGNIIPAKSDPTWVSSCKIADQASSLSPSKRIAKYWIDFPSDNEVEEIGEVKEEVSTQSKSPKSPRKLKSSDSGLGSTPTSAATPGKRKRFHRVRPIIESSDEEDTKTKVKPNSKSEDDDDYAPSKEEAMESEKENSSESSEEIDSDILAEITPEPEDCTPKSSKKRKDHGKSNGNSKNVAINADAKNNISTPATPVSSKSAEFKSRLSKFSNADDSPVPSPAGSSNGFSKINGNEEDLSSDGTGQWPHLKYRWLQPGEIKDAKRRKPTDPDYDPKTLCIPKDFLDSLTPAVRQWWDMKAQYFDTILFFKLGKFYELYNMDAVTAVQELGLNFMKGDTAHCGFPEIGYSRYSSILVQNGHKVARIEQTETPEMMTARCQKKGKATKFDKVVRREICQISTKGIRIPSIQDDSNNPFLPGSEYLYAITEKVQFNARSEYGVCFIDTTIGTFYIAQFTDDRNCSRLRTLFSHYVPVQILHEKNKISPHLRELLNNVGSHVRKDALISESEFWSGSKVLKFLAEGSYFSQKDETFDAVLDWPDNLQNLLCKNDTLGLTPDQNWVLGLSALGAVVWFLKECLVEHDVLSLKRFEIYTPVDSHQNSEAEDSQPSQVNSSQGAVPRNKFLVLDGITLRNLDIVDSPSSLLSVLDKCCTSFGKRLLRQWLCTPLGLPDEISERLNAIEDFMKNPEIGETIVPLLKSLQKVDLERMLTKVHTLGSLHRSKDHPDSRAFMFDDKIYSKRRIENLTSILKNFKLCSHIHKELKALCSGEERSAILTRLVSEYPDLSEQFKYFDNAFDHKHALAEGKIIPADGVDPEYDAAKAEINEIEAEAKAYLKEIQNQLKERVTFFGSDKRRFQLEVPEKARVSNQFEISSNRKGFKRYVTSETKEFLARTLAAEAHRDAALKDITRRIFEQFDLHRDLWSKAVSIIGTIDVLISLSVFSASENTCRPNVTYSARPFQIIENGRHPCISQDTYIPNDTTLGYDSKGNFVLLTGPNMGGKSTLMRQLGLITVLAHLGCYVPASKCEMSVVDRIFTRLGANDNIGEGESTFFVELSETSAILRHSTPHSLVLIDELGRGTATYDGTSIAFAVACKLADKNCRTIFSTHYHALVESIQHMSSVQLGHMACMVENENEDDPTQETITFLYKLVGGPCPKSYGFNAAKLAGISQEIIRVAYKKAKELEQSVKKVEDFRNVCSDIEKNVSSLEKLVLS